MKIVAIAITVAVWMMYLFSKDRVAVSRGNHIAINVLYALMLIWVIAYV